MPARMRLGRHQHAVRLRRGQRGMEGLGGAVARARRTSSRPERPVSRLRSPFCRASAKLRPIAIASPTDFMEVVSVAGVPGNFSKVKRGIFTTT